MNPPPDVFRFALRSLRRRPSVTLICVLVMALAIGANTAIFSFVNATLLRPLPFPAAQRLAFVASLNKKAEPTSVSYPDYLDWRTQSRTLENLAAFNDTDLTFTQADVTDRVAAEMVTDNYFATLAVPPLLGRTFRSPEAVSGTAPVALVSFALWRDRLGSDPRILGGAIKLNHTAYTVIGVMPAGFRGLTGKAALWIPLAMFNQVSPSLAQYGFLTTRNIRFLRAVGRVRAGRSLARAQSEMETIASQLARAYPADDAGFGIRVVPLREQMVGKTGSALLVLLCAAAMLLLIACLNVANLLIARSAERGQEIAIRIALGARRDHLVWQLLTESVLLGLLGGGFGLLLASWGVRLLPGLIPVELPSFAGVTIDAPVLAFTLLTSVLTGVAFGLLPALRTSHPEATDALKEDRGRAGLGQRGGRLRSALVVAELALSAVLLVAAGLLFRTFLSLRGVALGFEPRDLVTMHLDLADDRFTEDQKKVIAHRLLEQVRALPGIASAALSTDIFFGAGVENVITIEGRMANGPQDQLKAFRHTVSPRFFATLGAPLLRGRDFTAQDDARAPGAVIVSKSAAERYWSGQQALGKRLKMGGATSKEPWRSVVGVVGDVRYRSLIEDPGANPDLYLPIGQDSVDRLNLVVRSRVQPATVVATVRSGFRQIAPETPIYDIATLEQLFATQTAKSRFSALVTGAFSLLALVLATLGVYGVIAYATAQRGYEIGLRMALGAAPANVLGLVLGQGLRLVVAGTVIGLLGAFALTRVLTSQLYSVTATDPATFAGVFTILALTALAACWLPAFRASRLDPAAKLRNG